MLDQVGTLGIDRLIRVEFLQFANQTIATPDAIADSDDVFSLAALPHPTGFVAPEITISGSPDNYEKVDGGSGVDVIWGGGGHSDVLRGGAGDDDLNGGDGDGDVAVYTGAKADYTVVENPDDTVTVTDTAGNEGTDTLTDIETIVFGDGIYIPGGISPPPPPPPNGSKPPVDLPAETHSGSAADGEHLTDTSGGGNWDVLAGGNGNDAYIVLTENSIVLQEGTSGGTDTLYSDASVTIMPLHFEIAYLLENADNISGTNFSNYIEGNDKANAIYSLKDTDELAGWGGGDMLYGGADNDFINGGDSVDTAVFSGVLANYLVEEQGDGSVTVLDLVGNNGTDRVIGVEFLEFADQTIETPGLVVGSLSAEPLSALPGPNNILPPTSTISGTLEGY